MEHFAERRAQGNAPQKRVQSMPFPDGVVSSAAVSRAPAGQVARLEQVREGRLGPLRTLERVWRRLREVVDLLSAAEGKMGHGEASRLPGDQS